MLAAGVVLGAVVPAAAGAQVPESGNDGAPVTVVPDLVAPPGPTEVEVAPAEEQVAPSPSPAPATTVPETTVPETSAPETTVPETVPATPEGAPANVGGARAAAEVLSTSPGSTLIRQDQQFRAYLNAGENLDVNFTQVRDLQPDSGPVTVFVRGPGGVSQTCTLQANAGNGAECDFQNLTSATPGIWQVDFSVPGTTSNGFDWTINVQSGVTTIPGRVYTERLQVSQQSSTPPSDFNLWYQSEQGFLYRAAYSDYNGIDSVFQSNSTGVALQGTCVSAYESYDTSGPFSDEARLDLTTTQCGDLYKIFFESPDPLMPDTATLWNGTSTWLTPPVVLPELTNLQFAQVPATMTRTGDFTFQVANFTGNASFQIDANNDGDYTDPEDRTIPVAIPNDGSYTVPFDGLDGLGNPISILDDIRARVMIDQAGEIHFVNSDVETRGGLGVLALNGPETGSTTLYWNDTQLRVADRACTTPVVDGRAGVASIGGVHGWDCSAVPSLGNFNDGVNGSWGDARHIDDWTYHDILEEVVLAIPGELTDLGDAPASYGTLLADNGPLHAIPGYDPVARTAPLMLGTTVDDEVDGAPSALALADDSTTTDDEDAIAGPIVAGPPGTTMTVPVTVTNTSGADAILMGWVDLDVSGTFDPGELRQVTVPSAAGPQVFNLAWPITTAYTAETYSRFRLFPAGVDPATLLPTGQAPAGEVEDHVVSTTLMDKVALANVPNGDGTFTVTYDITVTRYGLDGTYDLTDALRLGAGITVVSEDIVNTAPGAVATNPAWNGLTDAAVLATSPQAITGGTSHVFRATVIVAIDEENTSFEGTSCASGGGGGPGGVTNEAKMTSDGYEIKDRECREYPAVVPHKEVASGPAPIGDGRYRITYTVTATNKGAAPGEYDLRDHLTFGGSVTVVDTAITAVDPDTITTNDNWNGESDPFLAEDVAIDAATADAPTVHTYTVQVDFTVAPGVTPEGADCILQPGEDGTGLLNTVVLTSNGEDKPAVACPPPPYTLMNKEIDHVEQHDDETYTVTYAIEVLQFGADAIYDLDDELHYGAGTQVLSRSVANTSPGDIPLNGAWDGVSNIRVADDVPIASGVVHTYEVVVRAAGDSSQLTAASADCNLDGGESGTGLLNTATVTSNGVALTDDACAPIELRPLPMLPVTGAALVVWSIAGLTLIAGGTAAMIASRRRRQLRLA